MQYILLLETIIKLLKIVLTLLLPMIRMELLTSTVIRYKTY